MAIEKLPAVATGKRETLALLESMQGADLEMTGSLVAWPSIDSAKQCVLASFEKDRESIKISAEKVARPGIPDQQADPDVAGGAAGAFRTTDP
jgi:hypothetical protein